MQMEIHIVQIHLQFILVIKGLVIVMILVELIWICIPNRHPLIKFTYKILEYLTIFKILFYCLNTFFLLILLIHIFGIKIELIMLLAHAKTV